MEHQQNNMQVLKKEIEELQGRINLLEKKKDSSGEELNTNGTEDYQASTKLIPALLIVSLITMVLMGIYEMSKQLLHPSITIWQSHVITILFSSLIAPIGAYVAFKRIDFLRQKALTELVKRKKIEEKLRFYNEELEQRVQERTFEISAANEKLKNEIAMRRQAEEELRKYAEQLLLNKDLLEEKAEELSVLNRQLKNSEQNLKELNASKDKFFSILAHDLRSPFASVVGLSEFLSNDADKLKKSEIKAFISSIYQSSNTIFKLLENLLQWSQIQTGRMKYQPSVFSINETIKEIIHLFKFAAGEKNISIITSLNNDSYVNADKNMFNSILRNLVSNAIKFTDNGGEIKVVAKTSDDKVLIMVEDSGVGIPNEKLLKLFNIESAESNEGTNRERGTGLGLILCKEFVEKNGGQIWAESQQGVGSKFVFSLSAEYPNRD